MEDTQTWLEIIIKQNEVLEIMNVLYLVHVGFYILIICSNWNFVFSCILFQCPISLDWSAVKVRTIFETENFDLVTEVLHPNN